MEINKNYKLIFMNEEQNNEQIQINTGQDNISQSSDNKKEPPKKIIALAIVLIALFVLLYVYQYFFGGLNEQKKEMKERDMIKNITAPKDETVVVPPQVLNDLTAPTKESKEDIKEDIDAINAATAPR